MMPRHLIVACCVAVVASAAACGDDDSGDGGGGRTTIDTGLPATDTLDSLDEEDATQACVETAKSLNGVLAESELERISCVVAALSLILADNDGSLTSEDQAECKDITEECLNGEIGGEMITIETNVVNEDDCVDAGASQTFEGCDATVADYERCAGKVASELRSRLLAIKCEALKDPSGLMRTLTQEIDVSKAPECKAMRDKCPDIALSGGGDE